MVLYGRGRKHSSDWNDIDIVKPETFGIYPAAGVGRQAVGGPETWNSEDTLIIK